MAGSFLLFTLLRRLEGVLEQSKAALLAEHEKIFYGAHQVLNNIDLDIRQDLGSATGSAPDGRAHGLTGPGFS
ncbi:MAG: hypothetical protein QM498_03165 [Desulfobacterium sp.]